MIYTEAEFSLVSVVVLSAVETLSVLNENLASTAAVKVTGSGKTAAGTAVVMT